MSNATGSDIKYDAAHCDLCEQETNHEIHESGHDVEDPSSDWRTCLTCGARWNGIIGKYFPYSHW